MSSLGAAVASLRCRAFVNFRTLVNGNTLAHEAFTRELEVAVDRWMSACARTLHGAQR